jgi:regulator of sirC expression with transglutaminase-like and TPR domain
MATSFRAVAAEPLPSLDRVALALAGEFRAVDHSAAMGRLDELGGELEAALDGSEEPLEQAEACRVLLGAGEGFAGDREDYGHPNNSMLDVVLERRRGLPILLSVVYAEVGRRAGVPLAGVGLPGHFVVGHFGGERPVLLDPFGAGRRVETTAAPELVRPWGPSEIALRMLNNLVNTYASRDDPVRAVHAAELRLALPLGEDLRRELERELRALRRRLG